MSYSGEVMERRVHDLDVVELVSAVGDWAIGTRGVVVSRYPDTALLEVTTEGDIGVDDLPERSLFDDLFSAPYTALRVVSSAAAPAL